MGYGRVSCGLGTLALVACACEVADGTGAGPGGPAAVAEQGPRDEKHQCCAEDNLVHRASITHAELVAVAFDGRRTYSCGGFGARVADVADLDDGPSLIGVASPRCQNVVLGPLRDDGKQVFYLSHHGDSWVAVPFLAAYTVHEGDVELLQIEENPEVLYEGLAWQDGRLVVTAHDGGLRVYSTNPQGEFALSATLEGFENANEVDAVTDYAYVADSAAGIKVVDVRDPENPEIVASHATPGMARDLTVHDSRLYVVLGADGLQVLDVSTPADPQPVSQLDVGGSAQAVAVDGDLVAMANWSHAALYDRETLELLATEEVAPFPAFEQDLGIALQDNQVFVGEWNAVHALEYRPGVTSPDILIEQEIVSFNPEQSQARVVVVENRGIEDLVVSDIRTLDPETFSLAIKELPMTLPAGDRVAFEVTHMAGGGAQRSEIEILTNDPDPGHWAYRLPLEAAESSRLNEGDQLTEDFGFLDLSGDVSQLRGNVTVLAYFALF